MKLRISGECAFAITDLTTRNHGAFQDALRTACGRPDLTGISYHADRIENGRIIVFFEGDTAVESDEDHVRGDGPEDEGEAATDPSGDSEDFGEDGDSEEDAIGSDEEVAG